MRQGHQNRRGRNRNSGGARKGQNPVSRSYESNGPDMKIRGTPAHIAEKYIALSRDAQSNGDPVLAENYLQHAEHYNRIILAYRDQQAQQHAAEQPNMGPNGSNGQPHRGRGPNNDPQSSGDESAPVDPAQAEQPTSNGNGSGQSQRRPARGRSDRQSDTRARSPRGRKPRSADAGDDQPGVPEHEQPEFLRRSVRRPAKESAAEKSEPVAAADDVQD